MKKLKSMIVPVILGICPFMGLTGCYRMPTENDFSVVPTTNNPAVTYEKNDSLMPKIGY